MRASKFIFAICLFTFPFSPIFAQERGQNLQEIKDAVKHFLVKESAGIVSSTKVTVEVGAIDSRLNLAACANLETFLPTGSRLWGKTSVGVRCQAPQNWTIYVPSTVNIWGNYYVTARSVAQGKTITEEDITTLNGNLTTMPSGIVTEPSQAIGRTALMSLGAGIPLRQDGLRLQPIIVQGQTIRLISSGEGFKVSTDAQALNNAAVGQMVKVKINSGQVLSGLAKMGGIVEVVN